MSWSQYTDTLLKGKDGKDESYMAGIFQLDGKPLAVHPSAFAPSEAEVKFLIDVISGKELDTLHTKGCMLSGMKFACLRTDDNMVCLQRKKMKENEELKEDDRWPLCAYKSKQCILIRLSKLGPVSGGENTEKTGAIGDYLNAN